MAEKKTSTETKTTAKKTTAKKTTAKTAAKKTTAKTSEKKTTAKKTAAAKKTTAKKTTAKKTTETIKLTAAEKKLVQNYRKCNTVVKKVISAAVDKAADGIKADDLGSLLNLKDLLG